MTDSFGRGLMAGGGAFVVASWFLHCRLGMGPWRCQSADPRHSAGHCEKCDHGKAQQVRVLDILILGPWLVYLAARRGPLTGLDRPILAAAGAATVIYNARNYARIADQVPVPCDRIIEGGPASLLQTPPAALDLLG